MFLRKYFGMKAIKTLKPTPLLPTVKKANTIRCIPIDPVNGFLHIPQIPPDEKQLQQHIDESIRNNPPIEHHPTCVLFQAFPAKDPPATGTEAGSNMPRSGYDTSNMNVAKNPRSAASDKEEEGSTTKSDGKKVTAAQDAVPPPKKPEGSDDTPINTRVLQEQLQREPQSIVGRGYTFWI